MDLGATIVLPPELIDMILEHLPAESVVAFALTYQSFYSKFMPAYPHLSGPTKQALHVWLEQDIPSLYLWHRCGKLRPWRPQLQSRCHHRYNGSCRLWDPVPASS